VKGYHFFYITARRRLLSVTESIALPPRPKGGQYVKYQQIQYSRVACALDTAADLFCAVGRRCDAYSVVVHLGGPPPSAQANSAFAPIKRTQSSVADELNIRAVAALDEAREMPPANGRTEAMFTSISSARAARGQMKAVQHRSRIMTGSAIQEKTSLAWIVWAPRCLS
jgi:hypothetical protein